MKQSSVCCIIVNDEILLLKRQFRAGKSNGWCLPGGKVDPGENHYQAALREAFEETGITVKEATYTADELSGSKEFNVAVFYTIMEKKKKVKLSIREHSEYAWAKWADLKNYDLAGNTNKFIEHILNDIHSENN